jgi:hypothetical protein
MRAGNEVSPPTPGGTDCGQNPQLAYGVLPISLATRQPPLTCCRVPTPLACRSQPGLAARHRLVHTRPRRCEPAGPPRY